MTESQSGLPTHEDLPNIVAMVVQQARMDERLAERERLCKMAHLLETERGGEPFTATEFELLAYMQISEGPIDIQIRKTSTGMAYEITPDIRITDIRND